MEQRAKKAKARAILQREERELSREQKSLIKQVDVYKDAIGYPLLCPLIDQGITFFMSKYTVGLEQPPMSSETFHKHLSTHGFHPIVATSMTALGLAGIANLCNDSNFKREAMKWYSKALKMTNQALMSPGELKSDNTLLSTMLLSLWETTTNERTLEGWVTHVDGSAQLLKLRGRQQFSTPAGRRMYMQVVGLLTMNCLGRGVQLPDFVNEWAEEVEKYEDKSSPGQKTYHLHCATVNFRARILKGELTGLEAIVDRALDLDEYAKTMFDGARPGWEYEEIKSEYDIPGVYNRTYHIYPSMLVAQTWNWYRYNRIYIHDIIRNCLVAGLSMTPPVLTADKYTGLLQRSTQTLCKMQADIIASTPQFLHDTPRSRAFSRSPSPPSQQNPTHPLQQKDNKFMWDNFREESPPQWYATPATPKDQLPIVRVSGGYASIWALYIAGATPVASRESQEYIIKSLHRLRDEFGLNQCHVLGGALRMKMYLDDTMQLPFELVPDYLPDPPEHRNEKPFDLDMWDEQILEV